jgi:hypothetical protein
MYTLNLERSAVAILERVGLIDTAAVPRPLPWRHIPSTRITAGEVSGLLEPVAAGLGAAVASWEAGF